MMTSISSHSTTSHSTTWGSTNRRIGGRALWPYERWVLAALLVAADVALVFISRLGGSVAPLAVPVGVLVLAAGIRLQLILAEHVFPSRPLASTAGLLSVGAAGLWVSVSRVAPIDALLRRAPMDELALDFGLFVVASICTVLTIAAAVDSWAAHRREIRWGDVVRRHRGRTDRADGSSATPG